MDKIKSQQLGIGDLFGEGWRLYSANIQSILVVVLCVYIPINLILAFVPVDVLIENYGARGLQLYSNIIRLLEFLIGTIATIGIAFIIEKSIESQNASWRDALQYGLSRWPSAIGTGLLAGLILIGLTLLLIIPGIIWSVYYSFWIYVVATRKIGGKIALDYSKRLVQGQWWRVLVIQFAMGILGFVVGLIIAFPFNLISDNPFWGIIPNTLLDIVGALFTVIGVVFFLNNDYLRQSSHTEPGLPPSSTV